MNAYSRLSLMAIWFLCNSAVAEETTPPHLAFWKNLAGRWSYERSPDGVKGTVRWRVTTNGSAFRGNFQEDKGIVSTETAGWRPDTKSMVVSGFGSEGNHWHLKLNKVTPVLVEGESEGVLPSGLSIAGDFSGKLINKDRYVVTINEKGEEGKTNLVKITFSRITPGDMDVKCPWEWMTGYWKFKRSDGTSGDVQWSKPRANADYLIGKWEESDGTKTTEIVGWRPDQEVVSGQSFGANGLYYAVWFNKVSANKMSGFVRNWKPNGQLKLSRLEVQRINENLVKTKMVDDADGSVVTGTFTRIVTAADSGGQRRRLRPVRERLKGLLRGRR